MNYKEYFSKDYFQARKKFILKTKNFKRNRKDIIDDLTIDFAIHETRKKEKLIIFVSGTHGVEGYTGSAIQLYFIDKFFDKIKNKYSIAFIHALNPYGFKNNRRYNENNVDLNRNSLDDFSKLNYLFEIDNPINNIMKKYDLFDCKRPLNNLNSEIIRHYTKIFSLIFKYGASKTITALGFGQNRYPKGVCFAGIKKEKSIIALEKYIQKITKGYKEAIFIDIHTGASKKYNLDIFTNNKSKLNNLLKIKRKIRNIKEISLTKKKGLDHIGGLENTFFKKSLAKENIYAILEYGTINKYSTVLSLNYLSYLLSIENQVTHYGPIEKLKRIRQRLKKAYFPETKKYMKNVINKTEKLFDILTNY